jgi:hypothetical protein
MQADIGDWITIPISGHPRRGRVVAVPHPDGSPPYRVRWLDDDHETLVFPPPDAVLSRRAPSGSSVDRQDVVRREAEAEASGGGQSSRLRDPRRGAEPCWLAM